MPMIHSVQFAFDFACAGLPGVRPPTHAIARGEPLDSFACAGGVGKAGVFKQADPDKPGGALPVVLLALNPLTF